MVARDHRAAHNRPVGRGASGTDSPRWTSPPPGMTPVNGPSGLPAVSVDGDVIAFGSYTSNFVPDSVPGAQVFVAERG
jgi:hypothetical protein